MGRFDGRTGIVTGAGGDLGRAIAQRLAEEGARVFVVDRDQATIDAIVTGIEDAGGRAAGLVADVTDGAGVAAYAAAAAELGDGHVDLFVNNAGVGGPVAPIVDTPDDGFDLTMAVNVRGVFLGIKHVAPRLRDGGSIVNMASTAGLVGAANFGAYVASKHAVIGLTRTAALELAARAIRVNAVCPGPIESRMMVEKEQGSGIDEARRRIEAAIPLGRYGRIPEVVGTVAFLLSEEAGYTTGSSYVLDGGATPS